MADRFYGINRGQQEISVSEASSTQSPDLEVILDLTKNMTKTEVLIALEMIRDYIIKKGTWPPA